MNHTIWEQASAELLAGFRESHLYRYRREFIPADATHVRWQGRQLINFASNDYLGLTHHPRVIAAAQCALDQYGAGSGASPLICGYTPAHAAAEARIAKWKCSEACVLFPSGYQANLAAVQTPASVAHRSGKKIRFLLDKLCHASLIDAVHQSQMPMRIFPHNNLQKLQRLLSETPPDEIQVVITEAIFSMDGDAVDLHGLADLKNHFPFLLLLDEAHSSGAYGPDGSGLAAELALRDLVDISIVTLSKALGCIGGAVCASRVFCEALVNVARAYIYSTSIPAHVAAAAHSAVEVLRDEPQRQQRARELSRCVRDQLKSRGFTLPPGDSPIIPLILGGEFAALEAAELMLSKGILALAIRPPTVPHGGSRLRISLSSDHTDQEIAQLIRTLEELRRR
jgi:8-amino-7-oxononanoate synthase